MIINNTSLGFMDQAADCRNDKFCQIVAKEDNPVWQISAVCEELTGGSEKLPCESNIISYPYTDKFETNAVISEQIIISDTYIKFVDADTDVFVQVYTPELTLEPNKCYFLRYSVTAYEKGSVRTTGGTDRTANGTYFEIYCTDSTGQLIFEYGDPSPESLTTLTLSNIFIGCIRYGEIYDIQTGEGDESVWTFVSQTAIEKTETSTAPVVISWIDTSSLVLGLTYKVCITISQATGGDVTVDFGSDSEVYAANGRFCKDIVLVSTTDFTITLSEDFIGIVSDFSVELVPEIKAELFDCEGNMIEDGLNVDQIGNYAKITLGEVDSGCYSIGVVDSCSNYKKQFYGNVLDVENKYSTTINTSTGAWTKEYNPDAEEYQDSIKFFDAVCCGKIYDATINVSYTDGEEGSVDFEYLTVSIIIGGIQYDQTINFPSTLANPMVFEFTNIIAGCENTDIEILFTYLWSSASGLLIATMGLEGSSEEVVKSEITMDEGQICPEKYSRCLKIVESASSCDGQTVLIKYRNDNNAFGFDYTSDGFTLSDGFYNMMRIVGQVWKAAYPKTKNIQKSSSGRRTLYFSDVDKKFILNTGLLPEEMHDALSIALEHNTLLIDGVEFVCASEDYEPEWTKNSALAPVEVELFAQRNRMVNTKC